MAKRWICPPSFTMDGLFCTELISEGHKLIGCTRWRTEMFLLLRFFNKEFLKSVQILFVHYTNNNFSPFAIIYAKYTLICTHVSYCDFFPFKHNSDPTACELIFPCKRMKSLARFVCFTKSGAWIDSISGYVYFRFIISGWSPDIITTCTRPSMLGTPLDSLALSSCIYGKTPLSRSPLPPDASALPTLYLRGIRGTTIFRVRGGLLDLMFLLRDQNSE